MVHPQDGRGVSLSHRPCRSIKLSIVTILLAMTNLSPVVIAQTTAPTPNQQVIWDNPSPTIITTTSPVLSTPKQTTLAPFVAITTAPVITTQPISVAPVTSAPTTPPVPPTLSPVPLFPTISPTVLPSDTPSLSKIPSVTPSLEPTNYPTSSQKPTGIPSITSLPSESPSTSSPTTSPTPLPTLSPVPAPSGAPSTNGTSFVKRNCEQILQVAQPQEFSDVEQGIYKLLMQSYTKNFGEMVGPPQIFTTCEIIDQNLAVRRSKRGLVQRWFGGEKNRHLQAVQQPTLLVISFTMQYESRYGIEVEDYPSQFQNYINSNLEQITIDMTDRFLPVVEAKDVIVYKARDPTIAPSLLDAKLPSGAPSVPEARRPSNVPSLEPSGSGMPSMIPSRVEVLTLAPSNPPVEQQSFIVGLAAGLSGAAIVMCILIWYMRRKNQQKEEERRRGNGTAVNNTGSGNNQQTNRMEEGFEVGASSEALEAGGIQIGSSHNSQPQQYENHYPPEDAFDGSSSPPGNPGTIADSIFSNPSMVSGTGSFSSNNSNDDYENTTTLQLDPLQDEFDNYKNQDLEYMRNGVEESVYGAEGMMSLAMTRALMEDEDVDLKPSWGGAEDPESIEANGLCETNDWLRKNEHSTLDGRNQFFQEILNRMVITVRRGMISPSDGTRAIHCCAAMLGLQLEKELPNNVLLVHGMRKTNDLSLGRSYLEEAFKQFGDIEGAAIAPSNRGFGFVRFVSPKSVQRALERFRISEIEVQDVSVMIKSLKADAPA